MNMESVNLTVKLHRHLAFIYQFAAGELDYIIAENPSYMKLTEIIECECFMLSHILLKLRVNSQNILKNSKDQNLFAKIIVNLMENYLADCLNDDEEHMLRSIDYLKVMTKRMDVYEKVFFKNGPLVLSQLFFNILDYDIKTNSVYNKDVEKLSNVNANLHDLGVLTKLFRNIFYVVDLFFKDGINEYISKELQSKNEFKKLSDDYFSKYSQS